MKKRGIRERIFAAFLVMCLVFTTLPTNVSAADIGTIEDMGMDLAEGATISATDTITWPIEIFDYDNDGMLFEFASATGNTANRDKLDDAGKYVYMPEVTADYYVDFTSTKTDHSYVVNKIFPNWAVNSATGAAGNMIERGVAGHERCPLNILHLGEYLDDQHGGTQGVELIDFRDPNTDGLLDCYEATMKNTYQYEFTNAYGYVFDIAGENVGASESTVLVTDQAQFANAYPAQAVNVLLRPTGADNQYTVVKVVSNPGSTDLETVFGTGVVQANDYIMVSHSIASMYYDGADNWIDKVAAQALKEGDTVTATLSDGVVTSIKVDPKNGIDASAGKTVDKENAKYAVLVYRAQDLQTDLLISPMLTTTSNGWNRYYGAVETIAATGDAVISDWNYLVLDFSTVTPVTDSATSWDEVQSGVSTVGIHLNASASDGDGYWLDVSHFATFATESEAAVYGEKAIVYNNHYIYDYADQITYTDDLSEYANSNVADYTKEEINYTRHKTYWPGIWKSDSANVVSAQTCDGPYSTNYYRYTTIPNGGLELIDFSELNGHLAQDDAKYAVLVYRLPSIGDAGYATVSAFVRNESWAKNCSSARTIYAGDSTAWRYEVFDITETGSEEFADGDTSTLQSAGVLINAYSQSASDDYAGVATTSYTLDVSHFAVFGSEAEATAFGQNATSFNAEYIAKRAHYNPVYNNNGYGLSVNSNTNTALYPDKLTDYIGNNHWIDSSIATAYDENNSIYYREVRSTANGASLDDTGDLSSFLLDKSDTDSDAYTLLGTLARGGMTSGLLEATLGEDGNPVYREETMDYLADLLRTTLVIPEYEGGRFNYDFVRGAKRAEYALTDGGEAIDLASAIRYQMGIDFNVNIYETAQAIANATEKIGSYEQTIAKADSLKGAWSECKANITTWYDVAYYLLSNMYVADSYNETQDSFDYLELHATTIKDEDGNERKAYIFDGGYTIKEAYGAYGYAVNYDTAEKIITFKKDATTGKVLADSKAGYYFAETTMTTIAPFLPVQYADPVTGKNKQDQTVSPYFDDDGVARDSTIGDTYTNRNYNYTMKSSAEFVYHEDDGLFFQFQGDDDVYLFINGQLVLDIGGCHGIADQIVNINDYVAEARANIASGNYDDRDVALALEEGGVYSFNFFYAERHGVGANCRILTNMRVTDPSLKIDKTAYQDGVEVPFGGIVDPGKAIEYNFNLTNNGNTKLYHLVFADETIGVTLDANGLTVKEGYNGVYVVDKNGASLDAEDLTAIVTGYKKLDPGETTTEVRYAEVNGQMVESEDGDYIHTYNEITFKPNTEAGTTANEALANFMEVLKGEGLESGGTNSTTNEGAGLWRNSTVVIKGIYYNLTDEQKEDGKLNNILYGQATTKYYNIDPETGEESETLRSQDEHRVFIPGDPYYYQWINKDIIITPAKLVADLMGSSQWEDLFAPDAEDAAKVLLSASNITTIEEVTSSGQSLTTSTVTVDGNNNITVNYSEAGGHLFYVKVTYTDGTNTQNQIVPIVVNTTEVKDSYTVLDYGLAANLTVSGNGIFKGDSLTVGGNAVDVHIDGLANVNSNVDYNATLDANAEYGASHVVTFTEEGVTQDGGNEIECEDGTFKFGNRKLYYQPNDFMDGMDSIYAAIHICESDATPTDFGSAIDIANEVQMYKKINVLPANVVYYEDDFPAITYNTVTGNTFVPTGSSDDLEQSVNQDTEYGKDDAYSSNTDMSGNSITQITIAQPNQVASFEFTGTGFELVGRTNANTDAATMVIEVLKGTETVVYQPVITEFDQAANGNGGDEVIYQVPVIRVNDLEHGTYTVKVTAVPVYNGMNDDNTVNWTPAKLYIDGLRIYQPLGAYNEHYNDSENGAKFLEIKNLILDAKAAMAQKNAEDDTTVYTGTVSWVEDRNGQWNTNKVNNTNDYLIAGPNNELYVVGNDSNSANVSASALVFYVTEDVVGEGGLQIAARAIDNGLFTGGTAVGSTPVIKYGVQTEEGIQLKEIATLGSATEQYYTIDYTECPYVEDMGYQVTIVAYDGMVSYSTLKCTGLTLSTMNTNTGSTLVYENGILVEKATGVSVASVPELQTLKNMLVEQTPYEEVVDIDDKIKYQTRNGSDLRLIGYVEDLADYSSVTFTIKINGKVSKKLVCTTAYSGLYANDVVYTTEDIYGEEGYFVVFTINDYLKHYRGQEVFIEITYTSPLGEEHTEGRTAVID